MDDIDDLLKQVMAALDLSDPSVEAKLRRGLARGLELATDGGAFEFEFDMEGSSPEVVVLDGGRKGSEAQTDTKAPDLQVLDGEGQVPDVQVRVVGTTPKTASRPIRLGAEGVFAVTDSTATVFRGLAPRCYRVHCTAGPVTVLLDGSPAETLQAGCSIDVEASFIQVRGSGRGVYRVSLR